MSATVGRPDIGRPEAGPADAGPGVGWCELHCHTPFSMRGAGSAIEALVARARALGYPALAITDTMTLAGVVRFHAACRDASIRPITGCELLVAHESGPGEDAWGEAGAGESPLGTVVALARDRGGYAQLCGLLARANLACPSRPVIPLADLAAHRQGLALLVGGCDSLVWRPLLAGRTTTAGAVLTRYVASLGADDLYLELRHERLPESGPAVARAAALARELGIPCVAAGGARHAARADHVVYDLLTCVRLGIRVDKPHAERPRNAERHLKSVDELRPLFAAAPEALANAAALADRCRVELLAERCVPPCVALPVGETADGVLRARCLEGLPARYPEPAARARAERQLEHELAVIGGLGLAEFFLVVWDIVRAGRARGIRCAGRGSAANSLVAYALGITAVDPIAHHLLFERFLNPERVGMPDIDVDVQSGRRDELIRYVEETYSEAHAAMVANVVTYRLRLAVRDVAKALGFPLPLVDRLTRVLPHFGRCADVERYAADLARVLASGYVPDHASDRTSDRTPGAVAITPLPGPAWDERLRLLLELVPRLEGMPRHLSLHNGGILLTRAPLTETLPVRLSANGVRAVELDKDDVERLGFIKFDLLGLRTFDAIETCRDLIAESEGARPDVDELTLDPPDPTTMDLVRRGQTLAVFQIESPGQWHLLARTQPETFDDLVIQTALFRPGPVQAHMVHPYIARRQGRARVTYAHPVLEGVLRDTLGVVLFQEQVLEIAHRFAGLSYADADGFRRAMSHSRTATEMEGMRAAFVVGAVANGIDHALADRVFGQLACFVGYGFCRSHAAAFAKTIYQTAWLKAHYPAHYLAAFLSSQPAGFFPPATVLEEAKHLGIPVLPVDVLRSADRFSVERLVDEPDTPYAIRIGLEQVKGVSEELARAILWTREDGGPYRSLADFCARVGRVAPPRRAAVEALVAAGAFDALGIPRRRLLWLLGEHWRDWRTAWSEPGARGRRAAGRWGGVGAQAALPWEWPDEDAADAPRLPPLALEEEVAWDLATQSLSARPHPLTFRRRWLASLGVRPIGALAEMEAGRHVVVAGRVVSAQRPPTAKGMAFLVLEDETGRVQAALPPALADGLRLVLAESRLVAIAGRVERARWHCSLLARQVRALPAASATGATAARGVERTPAAGAAPARASEVAARPA
ncbi:MAG TPA: DNA polymerase III subunit alpha [Ktedonobacterales bacterium]